MRDRYAGEGMGDMIQQKWGAYHSTLASTAATRRYVARGTAPYLRVQAGLLGLTRCVALGGRGRTADPHGNISSRVSGTPGTLWPLPGGLASR